MFVIYNFHHTIRILMDFINAYIYVIAMIIEKINKILFFYFNF